jgi:hypothetical protein
VRDVVAYSGQTADENLNLTQHSIYQGRQFIERVIRSPRGQPFSQFAGHDTLDLAIDLLDAFLRANT